MTREQVVRDVGEEKGNLNRLRETESTCKRPNIKRVAQL